MILSEKIFIKPFNNLKYYQNKNYKILKGNDIIEVLVSDLPLNSNILIDCKCDICNLENRISYYNYNKNIKKYLIYTCKKCSKIKSKQTNLEKYGVEYATQSNIVKNKTKETNLEKYNVVNVNQVKEIREKSEQTNLQKYGAENPLLLDIFKDRIKKTNLEKYGSEYPLKNTEVIKKRIKTNKLKTIEKYNSLLTSDFEIIDIDNSIFLIKHINCNSIFKINRQNLYDRLNSNICLCTECYPISEQKSIKEKELIEYIKSLNIEFIESDKNIINPKHLDIYIPSKNLAIEFNGLYWHSEYFVEKNYHLNKSLECESKGIRLLHIWEDEWIFKQDIVKSIILNRLGLIKEKVYARQCDIREINDSKLVRQFLDDNHIQGYTQSSIKLGLFKDDELVSLMTFGYRHTNSKKEFELIRFCNKINTNVIGASSKLFKYFKSNYEFNELISYSDFRLFDGKMYETLGFTKQHLSNPDYFWCKDLERKHRFNFNKQKLIKEGFNPNKTEVEIMHDRNYYRVWGCGQYKWVI